MNKVDCSYRGKKREASGAERLPAVSVVSAGKRMRRTRRRKEEESRKKATSKKG